MLASINFCMFKILNKISNKFYRNYVNQLHKSQGRFQCLLLSQVLQQIQQALGLKTNFKVKENPLPWLEWVLNGADHTNFFENRVTEYEVAGLSGTWDDAYEAA